MMTPELRAKATEIIRDGEPNWKTVEELLAIVNNYEAVDQLQREFEPKPLKVWPIVIEDGEVRRAGVKP